MQNNTIVHYKHKSVKTGLFAGWKEREDVNLKKKPVHFFSLDAEHTVQQKEIHVSEYQGICSETNSPEHPEKLRDRFDRSDFEDKTKTTFSQC